MIPDSIKADDEGFAQRLHAEWQELVTTIDNIECTENVKGEHIEHACRILWDLWNEEDKRQAMGWAAWEDIFHSGNEELAKLFCFIEDRIVLNSESNRQRFYNLLLLDSDPTIAEEHMLRQRHWTRITQFGSRISRLKQTLDMPDTPEKSELVKSILAPSVPEIQDEEASDSSIDLQEEYALWKTKPALRVETGVPFAVKLQSRLITEKVTFTARKADSVIIAHTQKGDFEVATILLSHDDPDYSDFLVWLDGRGIKPVG
jgi:hypothetical protein